MMMMMMIIIIIINCAKGLQKHLRWKVNGELWARGKPSFTKPYCGKWGSAAMDPTIPSFSWYSDEETEHSTKTKKTQKSSSYS